MNNIQEAINHYPTWNIPLENRLELFNLNKNKLRVVYIYEKADTSTFRYRAYNIVQSLKTSSTWMGTFIFENELKFLVKYLSTIDAIVFVRTRWSFVFEDFISKANKYKIPCLFDIDDLVFDNKYILLLMNTLGIHKPEEADYSYWFSNASRFCLLGSLCQATIGTNFFLSEKLKEFFQKPSYTLQNFLNFEQIDISQKILKHKRLSEKNGKFRIGYFSGTPSHKNDFKTIAIEIKDLLDKYPNMVLEVVGFIKFPEYLNKYIKSGQIIHSPLVDFLTLQIKISQVDLNIVPLVQNDFTNCKSELKFFEAAIVNTPTCAAPIQTFKDSIKHELTGYLCNEGEWYSTIEHLYLKGIDSKLKHCAREYCLKTYAPEAQLSKIEQVLNAVYAG